MHNKNGGAREKKKQQQVSASTRPLDLFCFSKHFKIHRLQFIITKTSILL